MRAVIEKEVLQESFSGALSDIFIAAHSAVLGVTPAIIQEYLTISDGAGMFQVWFDKVFSTQNNYYLIAPESLTKYQLDSTCIHSNYIGAAFHHSGPILAKSEVSFSKFTPASWGVSIIDAKNYKHVPANNQAGAKIAEIVSLVPGGNKNPSVLQKYILKENKIFIFDKSINLGGADFICEITKYCSPKCKIIVMSNFSNNSKRGLLSQKELEKHLNAGKFNGTIEVLQADRSTTDKFHDRFLFLGDRFQLSFSSGIDCFGRAPKWTNSDGDITVHCVHNSKDFMEFKAGAQKYFKLKSKG
ncbi:hypothetical protein [Pseudomonas frederiksbergensis]|uniref:hypothetical protein n=1 Tax=Pseudomonas frederiksbergensis TaxID=104087 RepID=UPI00286501A4|nr:hypothetical protein [Pseudomonas frederiksbergensis]MDR7107309.1 hypothetical protein [Pseudomonas frederiksbergensis]